MNPLPRTSYPSDLTDEAWAVLAPLLLHQHDQRGRPIDADRVREYVDAILYVLRTGCPWRHLPHDYEVNWSSAHKRFLRWTRLGLFDVALHSLRESVRAAKGRGRTPTAAVVDSSSVKASPVVGPRGFDGAKKIDGIKRHILVDSGGLLLSVEVTAADVQDRAILPGLIKAAKKHCPDLTKIWADKGYTGPTTRELATTTGIDIDIVSGPKDQTGFKVQPRRWVVERTHAWINRNRRLVRQWEATLEAHTGFLILSQIAVLLRRLTADICDRL